MAVGTRKPDPAPDPSDDERLTIEQLAQTTGMTVRNIRNHQSRGLLPPPEVVARTGFYGPGHVERPHLIRDMPAAGAHPTAPARPRPAPARPRASTSTRSSGCWPAATTSSSASAAP